MMESTTVKVSKETVRQLSSLQKGLHTRTLEETIRVLLRKHRKELLDEAFGADRGKITGFSEGDRGEDHS
jgi:hypothetical protein